MLWNILRLKKKIYFYVKIDIFLCVGPLFDKVRGIMGRSGNLGNRITLFTGNRRYQLNFPSPPRLHVI